MRGVIHRLPARKAEIDRTAVRAANKCSEADRAFTRKWAAHARVEWPDDTELCWADAAGVGVRLAQHWLSPVPQRQVSDRGVGAVITSMFRRG